MAELYVGPNGVLKMKANRFHRPVHGVNEDGFYSDPSWLDGFKVKHWKYNL